MHRLALTVALLMPVVVDGGLVVEAIPEVLIAEGISKEREQAIKEIERLTKEVEEAEDAGLYEKALGLLNQILPLKKTYLG